MSDLASIYDSWIFAEAKLKEFKKKEVDLRIQICRLILKTKLEGTVTNTETEGYIVKAVAKLGRKIHSPELLMTLGPHMSDEEKSVYTWAWVPTLNLVEFKKHKSLFYVREQVTEKPGTPALTIEKDDISIAQHDAQIDPSMEQGNTLEGWDDVINSTQQEDRIYTAESPIEQDLRDYQESTQGMNQEQLNQGEFLHDDLDDQEENFDW